MYAKILRSCVVVVAVCITFIGSILVLSGTAEGQVAAPAQKVEAAGMKGGGPAGKGKGGKGSTEDSDKLGDFGSVTVITDKKHQKTLEAAADYIKAKNWPLVVTSLQKLLDLDREDVMVAVTRVNPETGAKTANMVSVRQEANRLIGTLPKEGLEFYRLQNNQKAAELLKQAKETSDSALLGKIATSYMHTDAGAEAIELLATRRMDRGEFEAAALLFERLMQREGVEKVGVLSLFKAKLAFSRCRDSAARANAEIVSRQLEARAPDGIQIGGRTFSLNELNNLVAKYADPLLSKATIFDWHLSLGGAQNRNAQGVGGPPFLEVLWAQSMFNEDSKGQAQDWISGTNGSALSQLADRKLPALPAFHPIAATADVPGRGTRQLMLYRSHWGIHAVDIKDGRLLWDADCPWSLEKMYQEPRTLQAIDNWKQQYKQLGRMSIALENSVIGTLSTDGQRVYCVDDLPVPPYMAHLYNQWGGQMPQLPWGSEVNDALQYSVLQAFDLGSGRMTWKIGGHGDKHKNTNDPKNELHDTYFLGPPLTIGGKLYLMTEKNQELRLVCLDGAKGTITWIQTLATTKEKMLQDMTRRSHAAPLAYGEGILVCPTNAGAVIGVDFLTHSLMWAYAYRERAAPKDPQNDEMMQMRMMRRGMWNGEVMGQQHSTPNDWKVSPPVIVDGKVVFTAPDGSSIDCLNVRDGSKVWRMNKIDSDQYMAGVYAGKVLLVGKERCRALDLKDGSQAWTLETGMPSGRGVASENIYYLPLEKSAQGPNEPEVCAIDVAKGRIVAHTKSRKPLDGKQEVPGNLLFYEGCMLSQTPTRVVAYPQLEIKLKEIDERIARDPHDPKGLTERGALRLDRGNVVGAVEDLRAALANNPPTDVQKRTKLKLYEAMTELFRDKFNDAEKYLTEYEAMNSVTPDPTVKKEEIDKEKQRAEEETQRRRSTFLYLLAKGREGQGRLVEAFDYYQKFGAVAGNKELVSVPDESMLKAPPDKWAQGRIAAMVAKATPDARMPLEKQIANAWEDVRKSGDTEKLRQFVNMFGALFRAGREARLELAEKLLEENSKGSMLEAEMHLQRLREQKTDAKIAARALEALARLWTRHGLLEDAAYCYALLNQEYAQVVVRDGKTGADLFAELATDKRFLPYIDTPPGGMVQGKITGHVEKNVGAVAAQQVAFGFEPAGEMLPFFQRHKVALNYQNHQFKLIDRKTSEERWSENLTPTQFAQYIYVYTGGPQPITPRYRYHMVGHIVVLPVANIVFGLDPVNKKVLWEKNLYGTPKGGMPQQQSVLPDPIDGSLVITYMDGYQQKLGQMGPAGASYVCLQTREGLLAVDPVTGRTLWTRGDVSTRSHLFGDDDYVYLVEVGADGTTGGSRAFRASDGVSVKVPDFSFVYQKRVRTIGGKVLLAEGEKALSLRLYDVLAGKDVWKREFKAGSIALKSEDPNFAGVAEPDGTVTVLDLKTQKEVLKSSINKEHLVKAEAVYLLEDAHQFYLAINGPKDANNNPGMPGMPAGMAGQAQSGLQPGSGMRSIPVDGFCYALDRKTGKVNWANEVRHQQVVLEHFREMPIVMFTSRPFAMMGKVRNFNMQVTNFRSIDKRTGKLLLDDPDVSQNVMFHALNMDLRAGKIELLGHQIRVVHYLPNYNAAAAKEKQPAQPSKKTSQGQSRIRSVVGVAGGVKTVVEVVGD
jgi:outer membrane protein assembly factor BamB